MEARFIYQNRSDGRFYDASTGEMRGGPDKVIVYVNGVLCAMDREAKIVIPVSRWKLMESALRVFWRRSRLRAEPLVRLRPVPMPVAARDVVCHGERWTELVTMDEYIVREEELPEPAPPEATHQESSGTPNGSFCLREMRVLSR